MLGGTDFVGEHQFQVADPRYRGDGKFKLPGFIFQQISEVEAFCLFLPAVLANGFKVDINVAEGFPVVVLEAAGDGSCCCLR